MHRCIDDPEILTGPLAVRVRDSFNSWACVYGFPQFLAPEAEEQYRKTVWAVLLGLDCTDFRLVHKSEVPNAPFVSQRVIEAARKRAKIETRMENLKEWAQHTHDTHVMVKASRNSDVEKCANCHLLEHSPDIANPCPNALRDLDNELDERGG